MLRRRFFISTIPKNVIREIIKENDFKNPGVIYAYLRDGFDNVWGTA
jgi:hypothetical protein